ncbi:MAG: hypothetical protein ACHQ52_06190 [Candidatus Eisenbacteria bacterium]
MDTTTRHRAASWRAPIALAILLALAIPPAGSAIARAQGAAQESGTEPRHGSVTLEPGYYPPNDPESSSVRIGRRVDAPLVKKPFHGGARSLNELGRMVCHALDYEMADTLFALAVREDEFRDILWPEFPQSRPATGVTWQDGWLFLYGRMHAGSAQAIREWGGHVYQFIRFDRYDSTTHYKNFNLHNGLILVARDDEGNIQEFRWLRSAVERKGRFKIYSMKD